MDARYGEVGLRCRAVAAAVIAGSGAGAAILLLRRAGPVAGGAWGIVTGSIDPGETPLAAITREIREETGIVAGEVFTSGLTETFYFPPDNVIELMPLFVARLDAPLPVTLDHGSDDFRWCSRDEAAGLLSFAGQRRAVTDIWHDFVDREPGPWRRLS